MYQPTVLRVSPKQKIQTCDGYYVTQGDKCGFERFYSEKEYLRVVRMLNYGTK